MLDDTSGRLTVHGISVGESVFQARHHTVDIVLAHFADVLEQERKRFEASVANIEVRCAIFVEDCRNARKRTTSLRNNGCRANVSGTITAMRKYLPIATVEQTRLWRSCTLRLVRRTLNTS